MVYNHIRCDEMHIKEFANLTGVSVRTLHYYDEIGLLKPAYFNEQNGYRGYDEKSLERMIEILFYRELDFPLKSIRCILSSPDYDKAQAIRKQKELLALKKERLEKMIAALDKAEGVAIITADHGNADEMYELDKKTGKAKLGATGKPKAKTSHTLNPVPFIVYDPEKKAIQVKEGSFGLANVAATAVKIMGIEKPESWEESIID